MARTYAEIDREAAEKYTRSLAEAKKREARLLQHWEWRGNKLPPFSIEPMPGERERLGGKGMTAADRLARKQWLVDQELAPHEPIHIKELYPKNWFRRTFAAPWDAVFKALKPVLGETRAIKGRFYIPRLCMVTLAVWGAWYNLKYCANTWENTNGWAMYGSKPRVLPGEEGWPKQDLKEVNDFADRGFKKRKVLLD